MLAESGQAAELFYLEHLVEDELDVAIREEGVFAGGHAAVLPYSPVPTFKNLDGTTPDKGLGAIFKWKVLDPIAGNARRAPSRFDTPRSPNDGAILREATPSLTWVGHATFAMRLGGKLVATDPIWSKRINGVVPRNAAPGIALEDCPAFDVVTVSHSHFDHLDMPTLKKIGNEARFVVPTGVGDVLKSGGITNVVELGWFQTHREGDLAITLVPSQHWSMRAPWDRNETLWGGFVYESNEGVAYHAGDTAFSEQVFRAIHDKCPRIDWAMIPIGAYDPEWFMKPQHIGPEDAVRAWEILDARTFCAMHWGTFKLTDEPLGEPPERLRAIWRQKMHAEERLWIFALGETHRLAKSHAVP